MNEFTELRYRSFNGSNTQDFPLVLLEKFAKNQKLTPREDETLQKLMVVFNFLQQDELNLEIMMSLLDYLGNDIYLNAYLTDVFIKNQKIFREPAFGEKFLRIMQETEENDLIIFTLLDSSIECDYPLVSRELLLELLEKENQSLDNFALIIDYLTHFQIKNLPINWDEYLKQDYPIAIKIQLIDLVLTCYSKDYLANIHFTPVDQKWIDNYIETIERERTNLNRGFTILQSMFYGDFENSGKGNNGGLAIFLKTLGTALAQNEKIDQVITLTITDKTSPQQSFVQYYNPQHMFIRLPLYVDKLISTDFLKKQHFIKRRITRFLNNLGLVPDVFHVRFLDNASKTVATLAKEQEKKLVITLTPDPHRNMTTQAGLLAPFSFKEFIEKFNKIIVGEELIKNSDKIVGIGNQTVKDELTEYFPQIGQKKNRDKIQMISEGIQMDLNLLNKADTVITDEEFSALGLTKEFLERPILLNVGRLNRLKAQDQLLKAWGNSNLAETYNLLIIGGDLENPNPEEQEMLTIFSEYLAENKHLQDNFLHLGALSNYEIRRLEQKIRAQQTNYPQIYLCTSQKEEFGIAILEAMSQEMLVIGPVKGGVKSYIKEGVNGFLIDTSNWKSIARATLAIVASLKNKEATFESIQRTGKQTVKNNFSMQTIVEDFSAMYLSLEE